MLSDYASAKAAGTGMKTNFLNAIKYTSTTAAMNMPQSRQLVIAGWALTHMPMAERYYSLWPCLIFRTMQFP